MSCRESKDDLINKLTVLKIENKALKESRNELLEAYKVHRSTLCRFGVREGLIIKAEALKEKESK